MLSASALAMPVDRSLWLKVGDLHFEKIRFALDTEVQPKDLATAELLPAGEILVTPLREGDGLLFLYKQGQVDAVRLHVGRTPSTPSLDLHEARHVCSTAESKTVDGEVYLIATVETEACREALKRALDGDAVAADHLRLTYTVPGLQEQLRAMKTRLEEAGVTGIGLGYAGATLTLKGSVDAATHTRALGILWREALGHLDLDDQIDVTAAPETPHAP